MTRHGAPRSTVLALPEVLALMRRIKNHPAADTFSPWFRTYYADLDGEEYMGRYVRFLNKLLRMLGRGVTGMEVLDAGCGFGIMSVLVALQGACVTGLDCHEGMISTFGTYMDVLSPSVCVRAQVGDVAAMPFADASFDLVLSHEAISHYGDMPGFVSEATRVLRPGGMLLLSDSNNARNRRVRRETREIWRAFELGPPGVQAHGHRVERPFVDVRRRLFIERGLSEADAAVMARETSGLWGAELESAADHYQGTGETPGMRYRDGQCPIDPIHGYYIEQLVDPMALACDLERLGLATRVRAYLGGARGGALSIINDMVTWEPLTPLVLPLAKSFRLLATKPAEVPSR